MRIFFSKKPRSLNKSGKAKQFIKRKYPFQLFRIRRNSQPLFFEISKYLQKITMFAVFILMAQLTCLSLMEFIFFRYVPNPWIQNIDFPASKAYKILKRINPNADFLLIIKANGKMRIKDVDYSLKEVGQILSELKKHVQNNDNAVFFKINKPSIYFTDHSRILLAIDADCEMQYVQSVVNILASNGFNDFIFLTEKM